MAKKQNLADLRFAIIGGGGFLGFHIGKELEELGCRVSLLDIAKPHEEWGPHKIPFVKCDVLNLDGLRTGIKGCDVVIHTVSYGMSGVEQLNLDKTEEVNVMGTGNVLKACDELGVKGLIYTSTVNVVFGGQEIENGKEEELEYFPLHRHVDHYSRTKSIAEQLVLIADNKRSGLRTCALRLQGLMGVGERRHLPRIVDNLGVFKFTYGEKNSRVQFTSIWNAVDAHVKAGLKIVSEPETVGGEAFFITDGTAINNFEYFRPLIEGLGYTFPSVNLPLWLMFIFSFFSRTWPTKLLIPLLNPAEIYKTGVNHVFSNGKAERLLDYKPKKPNDTRDIVKYYQEKRERRSKMMQWSMWELKFLVALVLGLVSAALIYIFC